MKRFLTTTKSQSSLPLLHFQLNPSPLRTVCPTSDRRDPAHFRLERTTCTLRGMCACFGIFLSCSTTKEEQRGQEPHATTQQGKRKGSTTAPRSAAARSSWSRGVIVCIVVCFEGERTSAMGGNRKNRVGQETSSRQGCGPMRDLLRGGPEVQNMLHGNKGNGICFAFQDGPL